MGDKARRALQARFAGARRPVTPLAARIAVP